MNKNELEGNWKQLKGRIKEQWGKLTDDDLDRIEGRRDRLVGLIQEKYGESREAVDRKVSDLFAKQPSKSSKEAL